MVLGMRSKVDKLVSDLLLLTQDCNNHLPTAGGMGGSFLWNPSVNIPTPQPPGSQAQGMVTSTEMARLVAMVEDVGQLVKGGGLKTQAQDFRSY